MAETPSKIHYPTNADTFDPAGDMETLARSVSHVVPVDNAAERNAIADAYNPSAGRPLFVYRADTGNLERTAGSGWATFDPTDTGWVSASHSETGWEISTSVRRVGKTCYASIDWRRTGNNFSGVTLTLVDAAAMPEGFRPGRVLYHSGKIINQNTREPITVEQVESGTIRGVAVTMNTNHRLRGTISWPAA